MMTRELLLEKSVDSLREIAKAQGVKSVTKYRKSELIDVIMNGGIIPRALDKQAMLRESMQRARKDEITIEKIPAATEKPRAVVSASPVSNQQKSMERIDTSQQPPVTQQNAESTREIVSTPPQQATHSPSASMSPSQPTQSQPAPQDNRSGYTPAYMPRQQNYPQGGFQKNNYDRRDNFQSNSGRNKNNFNSGRNNGYNRRNDSSDQYFGSQQSAQQYQQNAYQQNYYQQNAPGFQGIYAPNEFRQDYRQQGMYQQQNGYQQNMYPQNMGYSQQAPGFNAPAGFQPQKQDTFFSPEYNTTNPAIPEIIESGECDDAEGIVELMNDGYAFLRVSNYSAGSDDIYVSQSQVRRFKLRNGDLVAGKVKQTVDTKRYVAMMYITSINGVAPDEAATRRGFEELVPIFPNERLTLEKTDGTEKNISVRLLDLIAPIGKGQRGMIVSQPKAGKTTLLKSIAGDIAENYPDVHLIVLLIDERPEEVTDMQRSIKGEVVYSTFDELPEHHTKVAEMVMERSMRLVEMGKDVVVLMDSITRLARAYNLTMTSSGKTLSGGMDPGALHKPKRFFGAARNVENGGSLTIIATALVETGSRMDDMVYEEFKGTGNMEVHLDRKLAEKRIFPAIDIYKSGTRRDDLLLSSEERDCANRLRRILSSGNNTAEVTEQVINMLERSETNSEFIAKFKNYTGLYEKEGFIPAGKNLLKR